MPHGGDSSLVLAEGPSVLFIILLDALISVASHAAIPSRGLLPLR